MSSAPACFIFCWRMVRCQMLQRGPDVSTCFERLTAPAQLASCRLPFSWSHTASWTSSTHYPHRKGFQLQKVRNMKRCLSVWNWAASRCHRSGSVSSAPAPGRTTVMPLALRVHSSLGSASWYATS